MNHISDEQWAHWNPGIARDSTLGQALEQQYRMQGLKADVTRPLNEYRNQIEGHQRIVREATPESDPLVIAGAKAMVPVVQHAIAMLEPKEANFDSDVNHAVAEVSRLQTRRGQLKRQLSGGSRAMGYDGREIDDGIATTELLRLTGETVELEPVESAIGRRGGMRVSGGY